MESIKKIETGGLRPIDTVLFAEDGRQIVAGDTEGIFRRWRVQDGCKVGEIIQAGTRIFAAALSQDRQWLVCGLHGRESNVKVWNVGNPGNYGRGVVIKGHTDTVTSVDISSDSKKLATGSNDKHVLIWSMTTGRRLVWPTRHHNVVVAVRFSPNGDRLATAIAHESIRIYDSIDGRLLLNIPCPFYPNHSSPLAWSVDGCRLYAMSYMNIKHLKIFQGRFESLGEWSVPGGSLPSCILVSQNQKFIAAVTRSSVSFWDTVTHRQIGAVISHTSIVRSMALSPYDDSIAIGDHEGNITIRSLHDVLPGLYLRVNATPSISHLVKLPLMDMRDAVFESWVNGDLGRVEQFLTEEVVHASDVSHLARALAHRSLIRLRLMDKVPKNAKEGATLLDRALNDATESIKVRQSVIGFIALAIAHIGGGKHDSAMHVFDFVFAHSSETESDLLLLIRAILLFQCEKYKNPVSAAVDVALENSSLTAILAQVLSLLRGLSPSKTDRKQGTGFLKGEQEASFYENNPYLVVISLMFGWDFTLVIHKYLQGQIGPLEDISDAALQPNDPEEGIERYSTASSVQSSDIAGFFVKPSKAREISMLMSWNDVLKDANQAIMANPPNPWGYERRFAAFYALQRYGEAADTLARMASLPEGSLDDKTRQLAGNFTIAKKKIESAVCDVCPFILVDVKPDSGTLCNRTERMDIFKSEPQFKELISSMTLELDGGRIRQVATDYFRYVTFSHVWEGDEPSYQDVKEARSVWNLGQSPLNDKLRTFCEVVREGGYRWAWSDTCCINKEDPDVLQESLIKMFRWYKKSAATFAFLADADSRYKSRRLKDSKWFTRAWTAQELLAPKVIRFYDCNWKPYLGDTLPNHKESPEIMQELVDSIDLPQEIIRCFDPTVLTVREKLRLASTREATKEEDIAYSLIGIFQSDIQPCYGEGAAALGHLLSETVSRSGEPTVLAWTGQSSSYNSCLPATLAVYKQPTLGSPAITEGEIDRRVAMLETSIFLAEAMRIHDQFTGLPPIRFAGCRLFLPCITFTIKTIYMQHSSSHEYFYRVRVSGIGHVEFSTLDKLSMIEPCKHILVHPWIGDLCDPPDKFARGSLPIGNEPDSDLEGNNDAAPTLPLHAVRAVTKDTARRALRLIVRLQQPFQALLLQQQPYGQFKRVATEHEIVVSGLDPKIDFAEDIHAQVLEIL